MEKEFVLYPEALELKQLGFDEPCFGRFDGRGKNKGKIWYEMPNTGQDSIPVGDVLAPTYSQAFRWFREKYGYDCSFEDELVYDDDDKEIEMWHFFIYKTKQASDKKMTFCSNDYGTYVESFCREEAELACLRKLIEIVKNK